MFIVVGTDTYEKELNRWSKVDKEAARKIPTQLKENPYVGKQLTYPFLREKKVRDKRLYYLVYEDLKLVLLVAASGKKNQQVTINHIKNNLNEFRIVAEDISKQVF